MQLIFVTGARGAIGQHVVRIARGRGDVVAGLGYGEWGNDQGLPEIDYWLSGSISEDNLAALVQQAGVPDAIIHLAGGSLVGASIQNPAEDFRRTVEGTQQFLEWHRKTSPSARAVIVSSAAVYGNGHDGPIPETANCLPTSPYGAHKAMAEISARAHGLQHGNHLAIVRLFSVYGPGLRKQLIWDIASRLIKGDRAFSLVGTGAERRDFLYIADAAQLLLDAVAFADTSTPIFNGCCGLPVRVIDVIEQITLHFPGTAIDFSGQARMGDPFSLVGDATKLQKTGVATPTAFTDGIAKTLSWIRSIARQRGPDL